MSPDLAPLVGRDPVWAGFYAPLEERTGILRLPRDTPLTSAGWRVKVLWAVAARHREPVTVSAEDVETRAAVTIEVDGGPASPVGVLDPREPGTAVQPGSPTEFPSYVSFPSAGCYALEARWSGGRWRMVLGVGR